MKFLCGPGAVSVHISLLRISSRQLDATETGSGGGGKSAGGEFLARLENGIHTLAGAAGKQLSGGGGSASPWPARF